MPGEFLAPHTLVLQTESGNVLLYQSLLRRGVLTDMAGLAALSGHLGGCASGAVGGVRCKDVSGFSLSRSLLDNPSGIRIEDAALEPMVLDDFLDLLREKSLLVADCAYRDTVGKARSLFDRERTGNFHQQLGSHLFNDNRTDPSRWWIDQKFDNDLSGPRDNPYLWVQNRFLNDFFSTPLAGQRWLDFGCGVGFYSAFFAARGADVLGVDPSEAYIDIARERFSMEGRTEFRAESFRKRKDFDWLRERRFDHIFLCDVFLYYYEPYEPLELTPATLLSELGALLRPGGSIYILDPHGCFHLQPWLGVATPLLVSSEYRGRKYRVTPSLEEVSRAAEDAGLQILKIREPVSEGPETGDQARNVTREFPLWWFFELGGRR